MTGGGGKHRGLLLGKRGIAGQRMWVRKLQQALQPVVVSHDDKNNTDANSFLLARTLRSDGFFFFLWPVQSHGGGAGAGLHLGQFTIQGFLSMQTTIHTWPSNNRTRMPLECGRKPEYLE